MASNDTRIYWAKIAHRYRESEGNCFFWADDMIKTKRLQRRTWVLEKHLSHTTRNEKDYSGQARAGMTNVNTILSTPVRSVHIIMRKDGLNPSRNKEVRKVIAAHISLVMELQEMLINKRRSLFTGRHLKRIRAGSMVARSLHLDRRYIPHTIP